MAEPLPPERPHDNADAILERLRRELPKMIEKLPAEFQKRQADRSNSSRFNLLGWLTGYFGETSSICALAIICSTLVLLAVILFAPDKLNFVLAPCASIISVALTAAVGQKKKKPKSRKKGDEDLAEDA